MGLAPCQLVREEKCLSKGKKRGDNAAQRKQLGLSLAAGQLELPSPLSPFRCYHAVTESLLRT